MIKYSSVLLFFFVRLKLLCSCDSLSLFMVVHFFRVRMLGEFILEEIQMSENEILSRFRFQ
jgi:hypothetical protein